MAIDTAAKRHSVATVSMMPCGPGVTPDVSKPVAWRQQAGWGYSGIEAGEAVPDEPSPEIIATYSIKVKRTDSYKVRVR